MSNTCTERGWGEGVRERGRGKEEGGRRKENKREKERREERET